MPEPWGNGRAEHTTRTPKGSIMLGNAQSLGTWVQHVVEERGEGLGDIVSMLEYWLQVELWRSAANDGFHGFEPATIGEIPYKSASSSGKDEPRLDLIVLAFAPDEEG